MQHFLFGIPLMNINASGLGFGYNDPASSGDNGLKSITWMHGPTFIF